MFSQILGYSWETWILLSQVRGDRLIPLQRKLARDVVQIASIVKDALRILARKSLTIGLILPAADRDFTKAALLTLVGRCLRKGIQSCKGIAAEHFGLDAAEGRGTKAIAPIGFRNIR